MDGKQFGALIVGIDKIIRLLAIQNISNKKGVEAIKSLSWAGFKPKEIADLIGSTSGSVRVALVGLRKKSGKRQGHEKSKKW